MDGNHASPINIGNSVSHEVISRREVMDDLHSSELTVGKVTKTKGCFGVATDFRGSKLPNGEGETPLQISSNGFEGDIDLIGDDLLDVETLSADGRLESLKKLKTGADGRNDHEMEVSFDPADDGLDDDYNFDRRASTSDENVSAKHPAVKQKKLKRKVASDDVLSELGESLESDDEDSSDVGNTKIICKLRTKRKKANVEASSEVGEYGVDHKMVFGLKAESIPSRFKDTDIRSLANTYGVDRRLRLSAPLSSDRACWPKKGQIALNSTVFTVGIRLPLHFFFWRVLASYGVAPAQIVPNGYGFMMGMLLLWHDLGFGIPTLSEWHSVYKIMKVPGNPGFYFFTRWTNDPPALILDCPCSSGSWKRRWFWMASPYEDGSSSEVQPRFFSKARFHDKHEPEGSEFQRIQRAYKVPERRREFKILRKGRTVCKFQMPKINIKTARIKELREQVEELKRAAGDETTSDSSTTSGGKRSIGLRSLKKLKVASAQPTTLTPISEVVSDKPPSSDALHFPVHLGNSKEVVGSELVLMGEPTVEGGLSAAPCFGVSGTALSAFRSEEVEVNVSKLSSLDIDVQIEHAFKYSFQCAAALVCARASLGSRPSVVSDLQNEVRKLKAEVKEISKGKLVAEEKSKEAERRCAKLEAKVKTTELEKRSFEDDLVELKAKSVAEAEARSRLVSELDAARRGEGLDLDALADSEIFRKTREVIEQSFGNEMLKMIQEEHPELKLSFVSD